MGGLTDPERPSLLPNTRERHQVSTEEYLKMTAAVSGLDHGELVRVLAAIRWELTVVSGERDTLKEQAVALLHDVEGLEAKADTYKAHNIWQGRVLQKIRTALKNPFLNPVDLEVLFLEMQEEEPELVGIRVLEKPQNRCSLCGNWSHKNEKCSLHYLKDECHDYAQPSQLVNWEGSENG